MHKHLSSAARAKDTSYSTFMTAKEYEAAQARHAKREAILNPKPIHLSKYGLFIAGLCVGALLTGLFTFVVSISGLVAGIMLAFGIAMILGVIGSHLGADK